MSDDKDFMQETMKDTDTIDKLYGKNKKKDTQALPQTEKKSEEKAQAAPEAEDEKENKEESKSSEES